MLAVAGRTVSACAARQPGTREDARPLGPDGRAAAADRNVRQLVQGRPCSTGRTHDRLPARRRDGAAAHPRRRAPPRRPIRRATFAPAHPRRTTGHWFYAKLDNARSGLGWRRGRDPRFIDQVLWNPVAVLRAYMGIIAEHGRSTATRRDPRSRAPRRSSGLVPTSWPIASHDHRVLHPADSSHPHGHVGADGLSQRSSPLDAARKRTPADRRVSRRRGVDTRPETGYRTSQACHSRRARAHANGRAPTAHGSGGLFYVREARNAATSSVRARAPSRAPHAHAPRGRSRPSGARAARRASIGGQDRRARLRGAVAARWIEREGGAAARAASPRWPPPKAYGTCSA